MKDSFQKVLGIISRSFFFTLTNYVYMSMEISFSAHWLSLLFSAALVWYTVDYWNGIARLTGRKVISGILYLCCIAVSTCAAYFAGYLHSTIVLL